MQQTNTSLPKVKGPQINDRDRLNDLLSLEKYLSNGYNTAIHEASTQALYQTQLNHLTAVHQASRELFQLMQQKGWYQVDLAPSTQVNQKAQQFANYRTQFPYS